jgi:hypothetical protein
MMSSIAFVCLQGDYYFYSNIANDDPNRALLNMDRAFGIQYKDYITGPSYALTNGRFAVDNVTGPGHVGLQAMLTSLLAPVTNTQLLCVAHGVWHVAACYQ